MSENDDFEVFEIDEFFAILLSLIKRLPDFDKMPSGKQFECIFKRELNEAKDKARRLEFHLNG